MPRAVSSCLQAYCQRISVGRLGTRDEVNKRVERGECNEEGDVDKELLVIN
jgi:hypothetical protein